KLVGDGGAIVEASAAEEISAAAVEEPVFGQEADEVVANCRFGVATGNNATQRQWVDDVGAGWWMDFAVNYTEPAANGAEFNHLIWVEQKKDAHGNYLDDYTVIPSMDGDSLGYLVQRRPGRMWLIGNEVDRGPDPPPFSGAGQGDTFPQLYARIYHDVYHYIKAWDPTALVAPSSLVQFTPGRQQYLDIVWDTYMARYGKPMPVDFWNMHLYILPEVTPSGRPNNIASVALGTDPALGMLESGDNPAKCSLANVYCLAEHDDMDVFAEQVVRMRTWMKNHGYQNSPLVITEYSILYKYEVSGGTCSVMDEFGNCFEPARVSQFTRNSFNYLLTAADPALGYPYDNYKLVQQWIWYGMYNVGSFSVSNLAASNSEPLVLTASGQIFRDMTRAQPATVNLIAAEAYARSVRSSDDGTSATLTVLMRNNGNTRVNEPITVTFYRDAALTEVVGQTTVPAPDADFTGMTGCAVRGLEVEVQANWQEELNTGDYFFWAKVDSSSSITEVREDDNVIIGKLKILPVGAFVPLVTR
ncbi:MAG: CARDB domain-containing protein, partial [Candidatus Promineifilaceae bacterium]